LSCSQSFVRRSIENRSKIYRNKNMNTETTTGEYMLLFRGPHWDRGLSPHELQAAMDKVMVSSTACANGMDEAASRKVGL